MHDFCVILVQLLDFGAQQDYSNRNGLFCLFNWWSAVPV